MTYNPFSLKDKTIFITGASSGIGMATAIECSKMGAKVIITGRNEERLISTFNSLDGDGHSYIVADLSNIESLNNIVEKLPKLSGIVHAAGIGNPSPFNFISEEKLDQMITLNFKSGSLLSQKISRTKKIEKGGSIVFISSISGTMCSAPGGSLYSASKGAIDGLVKGMAVDLSVTGVRVNSVRPGVIDTNIFEAGTITQEQLEVDKKKYPLGRHGKPEEVAYSIIYLLSDASQWVTGSNLLIDGGFTLL